MGDPGSIPGLGRSLVKEMTVHSSILAWRIPCREEPGRLQSMGLQRVRQDSDYMFIFIINHNGKEENVCVCVYIYIYIIEYLQK